jgi:type II secretion system protein H
MARTTMNLRVHPADRRQAGFTLVELLVAAGIFVIAAGVAIPVLSRALEQYRLGMTLREVERELQTARANAVTTNRPIRVRLNCPVVGQYRRVELIGDPWQPAAADVTASRCNETAYAYPAPDRDPSTRPNHDGPLKRLPRGLTFSVVRSIEFRPDGTARVDGGSASAEWATIPAGGLSISLTNGTSSRSITINGLGRVQLLP